MFQNIITEQNHNKMILKVHDTQFSLKCNGYEPFSNIWKFPLMVFIFEVFSNQFDQDLKEKTGKKEVHFLMTSTVFAQTCELPAFK